MSSETYHVRAVSLPQGSDPVDVWVVDGRFTFHRVDGAQTLSGNFMAPGLVDAHVHLSIDFAGIGKAHGDPTLVIDNAQRHLKSGVLALRDAGYVQQLALDGVDLPPMPIIQRSGWLVVPEGRFFPGVDVGKHTSCAELNARVHEVGDAGISWFKVIADFPDESRNLFTAPLNYPVDVLKKAIDEAHARNMRVMAHSTGPSIGALIEAGVDAIEHGMSASPETVRLMLAHGVHWTPTLATVETHLRAAEAAGLSPAVRQAWSARITASLREAMNIGVPILVGSDEVPHGRILSEMEAMMRHGMTPTEVIDAATRVGRRIMGLQLIEEGAPADLVTWEADPRLDLGEIAKPKTILAAGKRVLTEDEVNA